MESKPGSLRMGSLAREGKAVIHTSASHIPIQNLSLGRLPRILQANDRYNPHSALETQSSAARVRSFSTSQGSSSEKFRTRSKMTTASCRWDSRERVGLQHSPPHAGTDPARQDLGRLAAPGSFRQTRWQVVVSTSGPGSTRSPRQHRNGFWSQWWLHGTASHWTDRTTQEDRVHTPLKGRLLQLCLTSRAMTQLL